MAVKDTRSVAAVGIVVAALAVLLAGCGGGGGGGPAVSAELTGSWSGTASGPPTISAASAGLGAGAKAISESPIGLQLTESAGVVTGKLIGVDIENGTLDGTALSFEVQFPDSGVRYSFTATQSRTRLTNGEYQQITATGSQVRVVTSGTWSARKRSNSPTADTKAPTVSSTTPANGASVDSATLSSVEIRWSEQMATSEYVVQTAGPAVDPTDTSYNQTTHAFTYTFAPGAFQPGQTYTVALNPDTCEVGFQDIYGNRAEPYELTFTTVTIEQPYDVTDYFPTPSTGDQWTYQKVGDGQWTVTVGQTGVTFGGAPMPVSYVTNEYLGDEYCPDAIEYRSLQAGGFRFEGFDHRACPPPSGDFAIYDPAILVPNGLYPGDPVDIALDIYNYDGSLLGSGNLHVDFVGPASVTVPAGTFSDCMYFRAIFTGPEGADPPEDLYWARGVGEVLEVEDPGGPGEERKQLVSANIGGVSYP